MAYEDSCLRFFCIHVPQILNVIIYHPNVAKISQYAAPRCYGYLWVSSTWMPLDPLDPEAAKAAKIQVANVHAGDRRKQGLACWVLQWA